MQDTVKPLRIALDPALRETRGPELAWTWRLLLTTLGHPWLEVSPGAECDIAHVASGVSPGPARIVILAQPDRWEAQGRLHLDDIDERDGWSFLRFRGEAPPRRAPELGNGSVILDHDTVFDAFWLASGRPEAEWAHNRHGHPEPDQLFKEREIFTRALASGLASRLERALRTAGVPPGLPRWPHGKRAAACLTHDVDYPEVVRWLEPLRVLRRRGCAGARAALDVALGRRSTWHFDSWLRLEDRYEARSAFYFVARKGSLLEYATKTPDSFYDITSPRFRALFRRLDGEGAEIALHASYRAFEDSSRFAAEKAALEDAAGVSVTGNRHHYLHLDPHRPEETLLLHESLGFEYDSTLGHDRFLGWRNGMALPFFPYQTRARREIDTIQLPFAWMDQHLFQFGSDNPGDPAELLDGLSSRVAEQGGCLVVNIHDYTYDDELFPGWRKAYAGLLQHLRESGDFWIETPRAIARHWRTRADSIAAASDGLSDGARPTVTVQR